MIVGNTIIQKAYFIGIGGIGMSALAQLLTHEGVAVSGSDCNESLTTALLLERNITVIIGQKSENVPEDSDVVIYSDAVPTDNPERVCARELGIKEYSYFQMLGKASAGKHTVAVAGTHGKTTTTGMLTKILVDAGVAPTAIIGSIVKDFGSNYVVGDSDLFVVEACEYHDHLLELSPEVLVINNLEWDHTDYFPSLGALQETFRKAIKKVPKEGVIITNPSDKNIAPLLTSAVSRVVDYTTETVPELNLLGEFNKMNARAAAATARALMGLTKPRRKVCSIGCKAGRLCDEQLTKSLIRAGVNELTDDAIATSLASFKGTWRRFEYKGKTKNGVDIYDDYAHHPTELRVTLEALRAKVSNKLFVVFQPHLFSRTRDLLDDFANAFTDADDIIIAPIYAAREKDDGTISNKTLVEHIIENGKPAHAINSFDEIAEYLKTHAHEGDTIITVGAGDIYKIASLLLEIKA